MGTYGYSNAEYDRDTSLYDQINGFLRQMCKESKLDCFDLRVEQKGSNSTRHIRDVLLARAGAPLLSVFIQVQMAEDVYLRYPPIPEGKEEADFGGRLAKAISDGERQKPAEGARKLVVDPHWWVIFRGVDGTETTFEGNQFDAELLNAAFNAIEDRLIAEVVKRRDQVKA
jgi:hypothetical protein